MGFPEFIGIFAAKATNNLSLLAAVVLIMTPAWKIRMLLAVVAGLIVGVTVFNNSTAAARDFGFTQTSLHIQIIWYVGIYLLMAGVITLFAMGFRRIFGKRKT